MCELTSLLAEAVQRGASDLLLVAGAPPAIYTFGQWVALNDRPLAAEEIPAIIEPVLSEAQRSKLHDQRDLDFGLSLPAPFRRGDEPPTGIPARRDRGAGRENPAEGGSHQAGGYGGENPGAPGSHPEQGFPRRVRGGQSSTSLARYRANLHYQRGTLAAAFRAIPAKVPPFERLGLPVEVRRFADFPNGLVLVTGCTGQGKSTTLAAIVDHINHTRSAHLITIEDPIEFSFEHGTCLIEQRQIGEDSPSFASALRHVLRQRPDVILIGEMRDLETVATALTAAETGHLVLASLHTASAAQTLARIVDVFPPVQQAQVRTQLAASLRAIVCQTLVRDQANETLAPATEILIATPAVRRAIRDNETHLIYGMIETGKSQGMHSLEQSLAALVKAGRVQLEEAFAAATDPTRLARLTGRMEKVGPVPSEAGAFTGG